MEVRLSVMLFMSYCDLLMIDFTGKMTLRVKLLLLFQATFCTPFD